MIQLTTDNRQLTRKIWVRFLILLLVVGYLLLVSAQSALAQEVELLWQGETYTPPFYEGKSIWSTHSRITIVALPSIPNIQNINNLEYIWTKNGEVQGTISGVGKNYFSFSDSIFSKPTLIKVSVLSSDGSSLVSKEIELTPSFAKVLVYENNPLYGLMFHKEVGELYSINNNEVTFTSFPLFFSTIVKNSNVVDYSWTSNAGKGENSNSVTYRVPDGTSGSSRITAKASHTNKFKQGGQKTFIVEFNSPKNEL